MFDFLFGSWPNNRASAGLLIMRLIGGLGMMYHGLPKIQNPFGWMGDAMPGFLQACAAMAEFGGAIALMAGLLTPLASFALTINMIVAISVVSKMNLPFVAGKPGEPSTELGWLYLGFSLLLLLAGPGRFSIDYLSFSRFAKKGALR